MKLSNRAKMILGLDLFKDANEPVAVGRYTPACPYPEQYILRMMVGVAHRPKQIPPELEWLAGLLSLTDSHQEKIGIRHPFCYITVRHGPVMNGDDDQWHVDGFSMRISHLPEQNYTVVNHTPTEYVSKDFLIPESFDPLQHNLHLFLQDNIQEHEALKTEANMVYCMDPYVVHRRPKQTKGTQRTFIRISYVPIEIQDDAQTINSLLPQPIYNRDGMSLRLALKKWSPDV